MTRLALCSKKQAKQGFNPGQVILEPCSELIAAQPACSADMLGRKACQLVSDVEDDLSMV